MLFIFMGASCTGKSTVAEELGKLVNSDIFSGKDYLRLGKNENQAWETFCENMSKVSQNNNTSNKSIIYIISQAEVLSKMNMLNSAITVKFTAETDLIKKRFGKRMKGNLPIQVEKMIEKQIKSFNDVESTLFVDTTDKNPKEIANTIYEYAINS